MHLKWTFMMYDGACCRVTPLCHCIVLFQSYMRRNVANAIKLQRFAIGTCSIYGLCSCDVSYA